MGADRRDDGWAMKKMEKGGKLEMSNKRSKTTKTTKKERENRSGKKKRRSGFVVASIRKEGKLGG